MELIYVDSPGSVPASYRMPPGYAVNVTSISAYFDGTSASGPFLACLSVYSQDGKLIGRFYPAQSFQAGDAGEITFANALAAGTSTAPGESCQVSKIVSAASTNATVAKSSPGVVVGWAFGNLAASMRYLKLYDKASSPTVGTDVPKITMPLPGNAAGHVGLASPVAFSSGIGYALTTGVTDSDSGAVGANEVTVSVFYI